MISIIDIKTGNVENINKILKGNITLDPETIEKSDKIVFPGVGSFDYVNNIIKPVKNIIIKKINDKIPYLGICLGLEILYEKSEEGNSNGFKIFNNKIKKFNNIKTPHMGWNTINIKKESLLFNGIKNNSYFYFMHSYYGEINEYTIAETNYNINFSSAINKDNVYAVQFHPEKSGENGIKLLKNFRDLI